MDNLDRSLLPKQNLVFCLHCTFPFYFDSRFLKEDVTLLRALNHVRRKEKNKKFCDNSTKVKPCNFSFLPMTSVGSPAHNAFVPG